MAEMMIGAPQGRPQIGWLAKELGRGIPQGRPSIQIIPVVNWGVAQGIPNIRRKRLDKRFIVGRTGDSVLMGVGDSISREPYMNYRMGYSFKNPIAVKPITHTRERPFFAMDWAVKGPSQVKEELYKSGVLQTYPTVWRRGAKANNTNGMGVVGNRRELPNFQELGEAPGPTDKTTTTSDVSRSPWGFLDNMIKTAGGLISQSQQMEIQRAQSQQMFMSPQFFSPGGGLGIMGWTAIIGALGIGTVIYMKYR